MKRAVIVGLDSGSTSVNAAVLDAETRELVEVLPYERHHNEYEGVARRLVRELCEKYDVRHLHITGRTGKVLHKSWPTTSLVAEIEAQAMGIRFLRPGVDAVVDGGGSEVKFLKINPHGRTHDFAMNIECAAGSGAFLDVQARRLVMQMGEESDPERHFHSVGLKALSGKHTVPISGRCTVFAKTDMIHQQQKAVPPSAIVGGLHEALVTNIRATIIQQKLRGFDGLVSFQGGLSRNAALAWCIEKEFGLDGRLIVHELGYATGAIGAALAEPELRFEPSAVETPVQRAGLQSPLGPLTDDYAGEKKEVDLTSFDIGAAPGRIRAHLGIDVGSVSTNVALCEEESEDVIVKAYLWTKGRPIEAVKEGLTIIVDELASKLGVEGSLEEKVRAVDEKFEIRGACTTGSGRFMTGYFIKADVIKNEITGQATGAVRLAQKLGLKIDTIFEIGGQDSKYIKLNPDGGVRDYTMNKVCAAGCGSFLEEQADKLAISIKDDFARLAFQSEKPADLGDRCTVFIESVMENLAAFGESRENLIAGLAYSVASNYLNRVVEGRDTEGAVFFQGGTAFNEAVVRAFQKLLKKPVMVTPHNEVTGAVGAALIAKDEMLARRAKDPGARTTFDGVLNVIEKPYESSERICRICPNRCGLQVVKVMENDASGEEKGRLIFYGDRCDEMNLNQGKGRTRLEDTWIDRRNKLLFDRPLRPEGEPKATVGIPRSMSMWSDYFAFWAELFTALGYEVVLSPPTSKKTMRVGSATSLADFCIPVRAMHGAVMDLLDRDGRPDYVFVPFLINYPLRNPGTNSYACVWTQSLPVALRTAIPFEEYGVKLLDPIAEFQAPRERMEELIKGLVEKLGEDEKDVRRAIGRGFEAMDRFREDVLAMGREALDGFGPEKPVCVVLGRPYNSCDSGLTLDIASKLAHVGHPAVPMDFLPVEDVPIGEGFENMYWKNGERIIAAFKLCSERDWLIPIWVTNFGCGPDSFIRKQVRRVMGDRPYLEIELDEHTADAGVITRIEAFYDSYLNTLEYHKAREAERAGAPAEPKLYDATGPDVTRDGNVLAFSYMGDAALGLAAVFRSRGLDAIVLPRTSPETLALGRRYSSGKECVPFQTTLGDKLKFILSEEKRYVVVPGEQKVMTRKLSPEEIVFFDPYADGPCRFGQYNQGYIRVYEELGLDPKIVQSGAHNNYAEIFSGGWDSTKFALLAWDAICATDLLHKTANLLRVYEVREGEVDDAYNRMMAELVSIVEKPGFNFPLILWKRRELERLMHRAAEEFARVKLDRSRKVATVSMFGEIYVRSEPFINEFLIRKLEAFGVRTLLAPVNEWLQYVNYEVQVDSRVNEARAFRGFPTPWKALRKLIMKRKRLDPRFKSWYMPRRLEALSAPLRELWDEIEDPRTEETIAASENRVPFNIRGELVLSWGVAREAQHDPRIHGIVNIGPFGCMPSKVMTALLHDPEITKPVFDANYDGSVTNSRDIKIETFASQVHAYARGAGAYAKKASVPGAELGGAGK